MRQPFKKKSRDVGLAEARYISQEEMVHRKEVVSCIREIAAMNESNWILPGYDEIDRNRLMLRRQAHRLEFCNFQYTKIGCNNCHQIYLGSQRCECRICASCSKKYSHRVWHRIYGIAKKLHPKDGKRLMHLTLTKKTHPLYWPSKSEVKMMFKHARKLINKLYPKKNGVELLLYWKWEIIIMYTSMLLFMDTSFINQLSQNSGRN